MKTDRSASSPARSGGSPALLVRELASALLTDPFAANVGCCHEGNGLLVSASPTSTDGAGASANSVTLLMHLASRFMPEPRDREAVDSDVEMMRFCLGRLKSDDRFQRLAACQKLGLLGRPESELELQRVAREDREVTVRAAAEVALRDLTTPRVDASLFAEQSLTLEICEPKSRALVGAGRRADEGFAREVQAEIENWPGGRNRKEDLVPASTTRTAWTDERGFALFENVPTTAQCRLLWPAATIWTSFSLPSQVALPRSGQRADAWSAASPPKGGGEKMLRATGTDSGNQTDQLVPNPITIADGKIQIRFDTGGQKGIRLEVFSESPEFKNAEVEVFSRAGDAQPASVGSARLDEHVTPLGHKAYKGSLDIPHAALGNPVHLGCQFLPVTQGLLAALSRGLRIATQKAERSNDLTRSLRFRSWSQILATNARQTMEALSTAGNNLQSFQTTSLDVLREVGWAWMQRLDPLAAVAGPVRAATLSPRVRGGPAGGIGQNPGVEFRFEPVPGSQDAEVVVKGLPPDMDRLIALLVPHDAPGEAREAELLKVTDNTWVARFENVALGDYTVAIEPLHNHVVK